MGLPFFRWPGCFRFAVYPGNKAATYLHLNGPLRRRHTDVGWELMSTTAAKKFTATLEPDGTQLRWVIARVPFDIAKAWPELHRRRVRGDIEGFAFRTSLFPNPRGTGHMLLVNKKMQGWRKGQGWRESADHSSA